MVFEVRHRGVRPTTRSGLGLQPPDDGWAPTTQPTRTVVVTADNGVEGELQVTDEAEPMGPISYLIVEFPGNKMTGEGFPALIDLVDRGVIRILDLSSSPAATTGRWGPSSCANSRRTVTST